ncbi:MAG: hypothetical protein ACI823_001283, partial [Chitinophagales bacterium]
HQSNQPTLPALAKRNLREKLRGHFVDTTHLK